VQHPRIEERPAMSVVREVRLKEGMPTAEQARAHLLAELDRARQQGVVVLKLIHGYGSSGRGGKLRDAIRRSLRKRQKEKKIRAFVPGEAWGIFNEAARDVLDACPDLARDRDLNGYNEGITIVLL
jgi:hypothetical protein